MSQNQIRSYLPIFKSGYFILAGEVFLQVRDYRESLESFAQKSIYPLLQTQVIFYNKSKFKNIIEGSQNLVTQYLVNFCLWTKKLSPAQQGNSVYCLQFKSQ
ncbi:unnamed protein product [Paramecium octaurelia]|uniref:Uncharacterized protein n=1 Tax=Paramecium octaurelia TaxID=43137 RepID=A0A8S1WCL0_PAROT|nr:unnamed protein product [Paramecium octaurelia]